ncbi:cytidylate kinase [Corynebacterium renale]|uniref:(d)CMP kinase n=1 Tax=Corynebacterium renale TaxID=1724 RepID=UPI000DA35A1B|nr:(d)CMP kinase [Corynebacterium renale]SQG64642.1 cytidylate kinase [Corynebacterium renale]STC95801.1 cytidylate kinase [Corynebacterium renale]
MESFHNVSNTPDGGLIVAVDGPSGTGKSTTCRLLAERFGARYVDTGAMYRVATLHVLNQGINPDDTAAVSAATANIPFEVSADPHSHEVLLDGEDVSADIRGPEVTAAVSAVSAVPEVRANLVALQRKLADESGRAIVEGRDIGTTVLPNAPVKVFLTAAAEVRAQRRYDQDLAAGREVDFDTVLADVNRRDAADSSRKESPLRPADDAHIVDTSDMPLESVVNTLIDLVRESAQSSPKENTHE